MSKIIEVNIPDIGDFDDVEIIELLVSEGDEIDIEDALISLESDKASMDVPSPVAGTITKLKVSVGDKVSQGTLIALVETLDKVQVASDDPQTNVHGSGSPAQAPSDVGGGNGGGLMEDINVPDIGDHSDVEIIEVLVSVGDKVEIDDPLITLESDKASMDIPSPSEGEIKQINVTVGDKVSKGSLILTLQTKSSQFQANQQSTNESITQAKESYEGNADVDADIVVIGSGPGGYSAAFRAADLGLKTVLIEKYNRLGGVCLNVGCIPSKALLHAAKVIDEAQEFANHGIEFSTPTIQLDSLRDWKESVVNQLTSGLAALAKQRKVTVLTGVAEFIDDHHIGVVKANDEQTIVRFKNCIIAAGSEPVKLPFMPDDERIIDSTGALALKNIPKNMLIIGGGIIGLEMASVYHGLGSEITVVEMLEDLIAGADKDIVKPLAVRLKKRYKSILLETRVTGIEIGSEGLEVTFAGKNAPGGSNVYDCILVAVGRIPNGKTIEAQKAGVNVDQRGFITVDKQQRTNIPHIFAIGDIVGQPMLAHKAVHEAKVAAEVCAGMNVEFDAKVIPSVAYTDPEVAWVGVTETQAKEQNINYGKGTFPWAASGRSLSIGRKEGITKLLFDSQSNKIIGAGIVGPGAGELIAEAALAIETNCDAQDIALTIHAHPTLSETIAMSAEAFEGTITDLYIPKRK